MDLNWYLAQLETLKNDQNAELIEQLTDFLKNQQAEIDSLKVSMEGQLWSPSQWNNK